MSAQEQVTLGLRGAAVTARSVITKSAERLGLRLATLIPASLRPTATKYYRLVARQSAAHPYRKKHAGRFVSDIHPDDDLMHFALDFASGSPWRYYVASRLYYEGGERNAEEVERALRSIGHPLGNTSSMLEFACGYGRLTRHFVNLVGPAKVTVSDIDHQAVDFVRDRFGVAGFYSATSPHDIADTSRYDTIVVVSLFSHLPLPDWKPWLTRLTSMLTPDGVLLFSTLGMHAFDWNISDSERGTFEMQADGFFFKPENETRGRLDGAHYGVAYVSDGFVGRAVEEVGMGTPPVSFPHALNGFQDVYAVRGRGRGSSMEPD